MGRAWPELDHLVALTDDVGVLQHANLDVPNRSCGYCTDDVARALIVAVEAARRAPTAALGRRLGTTYLAYLIDAQLADGRFHNFMGYDRQWQDVAGGEDTFGRALWGLGVCAERSPRESWRTLAHAALRRAAPRVHELRYVRAQAYAVLGLASAVHTPALETPVLRAALDAAVRPIVDAFDRHAGAGWEWCEDVMTYDNARIPEALMRAGDVLGEPALVQRGVQALRFLESVTIEGDTFVPVGNDGWMPRGGRKARYGQQPLEAAAMVDAALVAERVTGNQSWHGVAEIAAAWFRGRNSAQAIMVSDGGCRDGIDVQGPNANMGAESTLAYLLSTISLAASGGTTLRIVR